MRQEATMFVLYIVFFYTASTTISEGRPIQAIIGRSVSFAFTFSNISKNPLKIIHNKSAFLWVWNGTNKFVVPEKLERVQVSQNLSSGKTLTVTIRLLNITKNDEGTYTVADQFTLKEFNNSVVLQTLEETMLPRIDIVRRIALDSSLVFQCFSSSLFAGKFIWNLNASLVENNGRYSSSNNTLSISNLTDDDQYNLYTCKEHESELESDKYRIKISGPGVIKFTPNVTEVIEQNSLNVSCISDCNPICTWQWTKTEPLFGPERVVSAENALLIKRITRHDAGRYTCKVQNLLSGSAYASYFHLDVVYGPEELVFNTSTTIFEMDEYNSITISCSADCFPPCQILCSQSKTDIPRADLRPEDVQNSENFTCHATNARNANKTISNTIGIKVKSGTSYYMTTTKSLKEDTKATAVPSNRVLIYLALGLGVIFVFGFLTCLLQKFAKCIRVAGVPNNITFEYSGEENPPEENQAESYWTIVSNATGELSTALEIHANHFNEPILIINRRVDEVNQLDESSQINTVNVGMELDGYIHPVHTEV